MSKILKTLNIKKNIQTSKEITLEDYLMLKLNKNDLVKFIENKHISYELLNYLFKNKSKDIYNILKYGKVNKKFLYRNEFLYKNFKIKRIILYNQYLPENVVKKFIHLFDEKDKRLILFYQKNLSIKFLQEHFSESQNLIILNLISNF